MVLHSVANSNLQTYKDVHEYLTVHRIESLFADLASALAYHRPNDVRAFLITEIENRMKHGSTGGDAVIQDRELDALYHLTDLTDKGKITGDQAREAILKITYSQKQHDDVMVHEFPSMMTKVEFRTCARDALHKGEDYITTASIDQ